MSIVERKILYPGNKEAPHAVPETKLLYHFETLIEQSRQETNQRLILDDSRRMTKGKPVETICGKQFKLPIWESCLTAMRIGEVCKLRVKDDPSTHHICLNYFITAKILRKYYGVPSTEADHTGDNCNHNEPSPSHNCSMSLQHSPYKDLNSMMRQPPDIFEFTFELVDVIPPSNYVKDTWQMSDNEKLSALPECREKGNKCFKDGEYEKAVNHYAKGLSILESLSIKVAPKDRVEMTKLDELRVPFLLNLAQVKLSQGEYYECICLSDQVLKVDPNNIKAMFRRAKAHAAVWNFMDARGDLNRCLELDGSMSSLVAKCLEDIKVQESMKAREDRARFGNMFCDTSKSKRTTE